MSSSKKKDFLKLGSNSEHKIEYYKLLQKCNNHTYNLFEPECQYQHEHYQFTIKWGTNSHIACHAKESRQ